MIYLDQAASSFPKPKEVAEAMVAAVNEYGANPGRGGHRLATQARVTIDETRELLKTLFNAPSKKHVWFYQNATGALNQALFGYPFKEGDHVVSTALEHNSVRRPLEQLRERKGLAITYVQPDEEGIISPEKIAQACTDQTKAIVLSHGSNVTGAYLELEKIGEMAEAHGIVLIVDASQTAGVIDIDMKRDRISMLACAGHKGLLGPQGTGVLIVADDFGLTPLSYGGTGSYSELIDQPSQWPDRYESGTLNTPGIAGLKAGIEYVLDNGVAQIFAHEWALTERLLKGLGAQKVDVYGPPLPRKRLGVVSFRLSGVDSHEVALILDEHYQIAVRAGLHCAPMTHETLQTTDTGLIRASVGPFNTEREVDQLLQAVMDIQQAFTS